MSSQAVQTAPVRPSRKGILLHWLGDVIVCIAVSIPAFIPLLSNMDGMSWHSSREDHWRFEAMPEGDAALLGWASSQKDLQDFRAERLPVPGHLVLQYKRDGLDEPARPDWESLGYRRAYLVSSRSPRSRENRRPGITSDLSPLGLSGRRCDSHGRGLALPVEAFLPFRLDSCAA